MASQLSRDESRAGSLVPEDHEWDRASACLPPHDPQILSVTFCEQNLARQPFNYSDSYSKYATADIRRAKLAFCPNKAKLP